MTFDDIREVVVEYTERLRVGDDVGAEVIAQAAVEAGFPREPLDLLRDQIKALRAGDRTRVRELTQRGRAMQADACDRLHAMGRSDLLPELDSVADRIAIRVTTGIGKN